MKVWLLLTDLHGIVRGKMLPIEIQIDLQDTHLQTEFSGIFVNDIFDRPIPDLKRAEQQANVVAIPSSNEIPSPWDSHEVYFMCNAYMNEQCSLESKLCPRTLLCNAVKKLENVGYRIKCGIELEWSMFTDVNNNGDGTRNNKVHPVLGSLQSYSMLHYENSALQRFFSELIDKSKGFPVSIETLHAESGKSIFEAALSPSDPLSVADSAQIYRMTIRRLATEHGMTASFTPKPFPDSAGCGMHVHLSLVKVNDGTPDKNVLFDSFLAGILFHMDSSSVLMLPHATSYRRLGEFWTTNYVSYGIDSRSDAVRLVHYDSPTSSRIELRIAGGDVNPYLSLYFCLKAGMWGIEKNLKLNDVAKPGEKIAVFPHTLREASMLFMKPNSPARELYGDAFVNHYGQQRLHEATMSETLRRPDGWEKSTF